MKKSAILPLMLIMLAGALFAQDTKRGEMLSFPANPKAGFQWGYLVYIPATLDKNAKNPILFEMNNTGNHANIEKLEQATKEEFFGFRMSEVADSLGIPLMMPLVLRNTDKEPLLYSHEFNRAIFVKQEGPFAHLDEQILAMFKDARKQLKKLSIRTHKKMLLQGYSASGAFAWRWTLLHPEYVLAAVVGGNHYPTFPLNEYKGEELIFPIGIADVSEYTGKNFSKKAWLKIPIFEYEGADDFNDPLYYDECYPGELRDLVYKLFDDGSDDSRVRLVNSRQLLREVAPNVQTHLYPNKAHDRMLEDPIRFLQTHKNGGPLRPIPVTDTSAEPPILPIPVSGLYWGLEAPISKWREHLRENDLIIAVDRYPSFVRHVCTVDITYQQKPIVKGYPIDMSIWPGNPVFLGVTFNEEDLAILKSKKNAKFGIKISCPEKIPRQGGKTMQTIPFKEWFVVPENLTFTVK